MFCLSSSSATVGSSGTFGNALDRRGLSPTRLVKGKKEERNKGSSAVEVHSDFGLIEQFLDKDCWIYDSKCIFVPLTF